MASVFDYIEQYGNVRFEDKEFNEVDNLIFSVLAYLDFTHTRINDNCYSLEEIGREYLRKHTLKEARRLGIAIGTAYEILNIVVEKERYRHLRVSN